ncbi:helix-turn-helix domain-containing protein [Ignavigranum ruoffiae]|uniref:transposase n=1 Tax=Ignavigranum ruoffiae TaxID=89093 RepID=UPI0020468376|nr:transposase [Ignavigranum ruoffiae]UPQ86413.1 helix-turn-helix domain-containing protein [Ignavigranum ruoffiae]
MAKYDYWITEEGLTELEGMARDGLTDKQIAHNLGIVESTLYEWKNKYTDISEALKRGKEVIDRQVENAMLKSALGFMYEEETVTNAGEVVITRKCSKPNVTAQIFWLKNRKPAEWRDKHEQDVNVNTPIKINLGEYDDTD